MKLFAFSCLLLAVVACEPQIQVVEITSTPEPTVDDCPAAETKAWAVEVAPILEKTSNIIGNASGSIVGTVGDETVAATLDKDISGIDDGLDLITELTPPPCLELAQAKSVEGMTFALQAMKSFENHELIDFGYEGRIAVEAIITAVEEAERLGLLTVEN